VTIVACEACGLSSKLSCSTGASASPLCLISNAFRRPMMMPTSERYLISEIADDPEVGVLEDRGVGVLVDRDDVLRGLKADLVLDRARDPGREVELG